MALPKLPYDGSKTQRRITSFLGINYTESYRDGEFADTIGLTSENYPVISQRRGRSSVDAYEGADDIFEWDGKLIVCKDLQLYYDGEAIAPVSAGKKQFVVVNTKLIVYPDEIWIDLTSSESGVLADSVSSGTGSTVVFTGTSGTEGTVQMDITPSVQEDIAYENFFDYDEGTVFGRDIIFTFADAETLEACYDAATKTWSGLYEAGSYKVLDKHSNLTHNIDNVEVGEVFITNLIAGIPAQKVTYSGGDPVAAGVIPTTVTPGNYDGYYGKITSCTYDPSRSFVGPGYGRIAYNIGYDVFQIGNTNPLFSSTFSVGDYVSISGASDGDYDVKKVLITAIDDATNTLSFPAGTFDADYTTSDVVTISRQIPKLDYICESNNRLWGVSNEEKSIYASALGIPWQFYDTSSESGSWSVAVGSEGDFTAICEYGNAVLCFKENRLVKVIGSYPSEYYTSEYVVCGVEEGSSRSLVNINETLFYKGRDGVYAYTGGTPSLISSNFGTRRFTDGCGGKEGYFYYLSMKSGEEGYTYVYDTMRGLWLKESNEYADAFTLLDGRQYSLVSGTLYSRDDSEGSFDWSCEFKPFQETAISGNSQLYGVFKDKVFTKLLLRIDMEKGSYFTIYIQEDRGPWRNAYNQKAAADMTIQVPVRVGRCDRYSVRIEGRGRVLIRTLGREFALRSERRK